LRFPIDVILVCIRWYAAYPLSYRDLEEIMEERGVLRVLEEERARREAANSPDKDLGSIMVAARRCDGAAYRRVENRDRGLWRWRHPGYKDAAMKHHLKARPPGTLNLGTCSHSSSP